MFIIKLYNILNLFINYSMILSNRLSIFILNNIIYYILYICNNLLLLDCTFNNFIFY